jgi:hypothetical protein
VIAIHQIPTRPGVRFVRWKDIGHPDIPIQLTHYAATARSRTLTLVPVDDAMEWFEYVLRLPPEDATPKARAEARHHLRRLREATS